MANIWKLHCGIIMGFFAVLSLGLPENSLAATQQTGTTGIQGVVPSPPPSQPATINIPRNGQSFSTIPITVSGFCPADTLVEIYKNGVFAGSTNCSNGSYSLQIDLFDGRNDLIARVFDNLNQAGPDSSTVTVNFSSGITTGSPRITLTTQYAKRGADPGSILDWPITISGGTGPYAISVDWGDKSAPDLISRPAPGNFDLRHTYSIAGIYKVTIKATDFNGNSAFLQLVAIANGPIKVSQANSSAVITSQQTKILLWPILALFVMLAIAFFVGRRHQLETIQNRLRKGEPPF